MLSGMRTFTRDLPLHRIITRQDDPAAHPLAWLLYKASKNSKKLSGTLTTFSWATKSSANLLSFGDRVPHQRAMLVFQTDWSNKMI